MYIVSLCGDFVKGKFDISHNFPIPLLRMTKKPSAIHGRLMKYLSFYENYSTCHSIALNFGSFIFVKPHFALSGVSPPNLFQSVLSSNFELL